MKLIIQDVAVDSGTILIGDIKFIEKNSCLSQTKKLENGIYKIKVCINNTWNGDVTKSGIIKVENENIVIADPCYITKDENWSAYLGSDAEMTHWNSQDGLIVDNMGGDGSYTLEITLEKI